MAKWIIDTDHTVAHFTVRHIMINDVHGQFNKVAGFIKFDPADIAGTSTEIAIDAASIFTGIEARDNHLRSSDFFDVGKYPHILFRSTKSEEAGSNMFKVHGDLTIIGMKRPVLLHAQYFGPTYFTDETGSYTTMGFAATVYLQREDFGMTWNYKYPGGFTVGKHIDIIINAEADMEQ
ncbi:MAG TPA: YceI family protein [Syntrophales bacterium]|nr:YceI family protein [Syntrophales bacterium]